MVTTLVPDPNKVDGAAVVSGGSVASVLSTPLTGFSTAGYDVAPLNASNTVLQAFQQLEYCTLQNNAKVTGADRALVAGDTFAGATAVNNTLTVFRIEAESEDLVFAASQVIDMNSKSWKKLLLAGNISFTTSNRSDKRETQIRITCDGSIRTFTFPAWTFVGGAAPANIAAGKVAVLALRCFGPNESDIVATYVVQA